MRHIRCLIGGLRRRRRISWSRSSKFGFVEMAVVTRLIRHSYRVNVFGFPAAAGAIGNPGLTDIRLVVEWLRDNIEGFGYVCQTFFRPINREKERNTKEYYSGDKDRMVLWGQSAGANAVVTYSYANADDPIVRGLIADSGAGPASASVNTSSFTTMAVSFGCANLTATEELACMQKVDAFAIQQYVRNNTASEIGGVRLGGYVADNVTVFANNTEQLRLGRVARIVSRFVWSEAVRLVGWDVGLTCDIASHNRG